MGMAKELTMKKEMRQKDRGEMQIQGGMRNWIRGMSRCSSID